jgi:RHS repeat-associated protein
MQGAAAPGESAAAAGQRRVLCAGPADRCFEALAQEELDSGLGRAARATAESTDALVRYSLYSPEMNLLAETALSSRAIAHEYVWFAGQPVAQMGAAAGETLWTHTDHLGTPVLQTDANAEVVWQVEYEPYGAVHAFRTGADRYQPLRFPGQEAETFGAGGTGVSERGYNIFRWYRAGWGRYTQVDPLGVHVGPISEGLAHPYLYVSGRPTRLYDDLGLFEMDDSCDPCIKRTSGPNSPSANQYSTIYLSVREACDKQLSQITNVPLRRCIGKSCDRGKVICRDNCPSDQLGGTTDVVGAAILNLVGGAIRSTKLCVNNWDKLTAAGIGNVAVHEWAHGCGWLHGRGGGVPGDSGSF